MMADSPQSGHAIPQSIMTQASGPSDGLVDSKELDATINRAQDHLLASQYDHGYWLGELESNTTMEAEFIMMNYFLGIQEPERIRKLANFILSRQRVDGTWGQFYGAEGDLSTTAECYFALKLAGICADEPRMQKAREFVLSQGGIPNTRTFTKIWFALFGQWDWNGLPTMLPELMLVPSWAPFSIYDFASWARATIVPLLIVLNRRPMREVPDSASVDELFPQPKSQGDFSVPRPRRTLGWDGFFYYSDYVLKKLDKFPWNPVREQAIREAEKWIVKRQEADGSWGGIQPPWVYSIIALHTLGYPLDHPLIKKGLAGFDSFAIEEADTLRVQACVSPLWDTGLAMIALLDSGLSPDHPALQRAATYLVDQQVLTGGDWQVKVKNVDPGGWAFEFENDLYPDTDDTSEIVMALDRVRMQDEDRKDSAVRQAVRWLLGMQSANGGWGAFDKNNSRRILARIPFADFGEIIDPPSVDVTVHVLEMLGHLGYPPDHPSVAKALEYVLSEQEDFGPWFGRWGVNYIYGTAAVLPALEKLGLDMSASHVARAVEWIKGCQNGDGGWGESCASYADRSQAGKGPSTASQTAWACIALIAAGEAGSDAVRAGIEFLSRTQKEDGSWDEPFFTGTGFPGYGIGQRLIGGGSQNNGNHQGPALSAGFMINYHMYRHYWPLTALGRYRAHVAKAVPTVNGQTGQPQSLNGASSHGEFKATKLIG